MQDLRSSEAIDGCGGLPALELPPSPAWKTSFARVSNSGCVFLVWNEPSLQRCQASCLANAGDVRLGGQQVGLARHFCVR